MWDVEPPRPTKMVLPAQDLFRFQSGFKIVGCVGKKRQTGLH